MTTKKLPPLFSDAAVDAPRFFDGRYIRDTYEEARAKDAELIGRLLKALGQLDVWDPDIIQTIEDAKAAGFTPSEP